MTDQDGAITQSEAEIVDSSVVPESQQPQ